MESEQDLIETVAVAIAVAVPLLPPLPPPPLQPFISLMLAPMPPRRDTVTFEEPMPSNPASGEESDEKQSFSSKNKFSSRNSSSKYDFVKVKVRLGDNADHYYILFRFLLSRMLTVTNIPNHVAIKIALELKKLLIDNSLLDVYELFGNYFSGWIPEWIGQKKNLRFLDFSQNLFYETIPSNLGDIIRMTRYWQKFISLSF
ncbi:uncharacterized protein LOC110266799 [Arachis ipaensis]|uniref:uncharacterized protein LOC110266799 n=1 Tax=Arachis ipaensis TaxID=130454 RepID=UPI000A2B026D|nr:uncharacterized protein LOC110266799 [Arachis ipaensis]